MMDEGYAFGDKLQDLASGMPGHAIMLRAVTPALRRLNFR